MKKKIIVAAVAAAVVAPLAAMADATVYGKVRVATQYHDRSGTGAEDTWGLQDQTSRLGIKGSEDLGGGLKAVYKMEFGLDVGDGCENATCNSHDWSMRNQYVGLAGGWGTVVAGRHDTPHKMSSGKLDFFGDTAADYDAGGEKGVDLFDDRRVDGAIAYISPNFSGFTVAGAIVQTDAGLQHADSDDFASAYSLAAMYSNGPFYGSLAYEELDAESLVGATGAEEDTKWRIGLGILGMSGFSAALVYEDRSDTDFVEGADSEAWQISAAYDFGNNRVKAMFGDFDADAAGGDFDTWAIGFQHNMSKRTDVQVLYRQKDSDSSAGIDDDVFALQLDHSF